MALTKSELKRWTDALRASPEQQISGRLTNEDMTGFCCLGKLCQIMGLESEIDTLNDIVLFKYENSSHFEVLPETFAYEKFGVDSSCGRDVNCGEFNELAMPELEFEGRVHYSAAEANDAEVPWDVIADHFDKYYPAVDD